MNDDKTFGRIFNLAATKLFTSLGTNVGTIVSVLTLFGMGFIAGTHFNDNRKNIEILDIKKNAFEEFKNLTLEVGRLNKVNEDIKRDLADAQKTINKFKFEADERQESR